MSETGLDASALAVQPTPDPVVLVTGATGALGRVVVARFAIDGARLVLVGTDEGRLEAVAAESEVAAGRWAPVVADLRDAGAAKAAVHEGEARFGRIDVLVHLVGGYSGGTPVVDLDHAELRSMLDQHVWTTLNVVQAVVPGMVSRGFGRVLAISTPSAERPGPRSASYAIAKSGEEILLRSLAREVGGQGVTANLVVVKKIDAAHERESERAAKSASWSTPEEIADVLVYLASPGASAINGQRIGVDGRG
jgi:NAD(P)-dependent dehydrogenase (short-subunit alcohol dehydrogenase family)